MFDAVVSSLSCLFGITSECSLQGAGGATPPAQLIITTIAAASVALIVAVWNEAIKAFLKGSISNLLAATVLMFAAMIVPSLLLVGLALGVLLLSAIFRKRIWGNNLRLRNGTLVPLPRLVLPTASTVYVLGAIFITILGYLRPPPHELEKTVAFFAPSQLIGTSLEDLALADQSRLLSDIDLGPKRLISDTLANLDFEFHPTFPLDQHLQFRDSFGQTTAAQLDHWLSQEKDLAHLSEQVDIALEESAKVQSATGRLRELVVRAYVNRRSPEEGRFYRVTSGNPVVAHGTVANRNDLMLVLAVRLAAQLLNELDLPPLTQQQEGRVWRDFSQTLRDRMAILLDFSTNDPPTDAEAQAREAMAVADACESDECALEIAAAFEELLRPPSDRVSQFSTASAAYEAAYGQ